MIDEWGKGAKYWDKPWNPVVGCQKISEGCANCYAERICTRFGQWKHSDFQPQPGNCGKPPRKGVVFVGNMTDIFGEWNTDDDIGEWLSSLSLDADNLILTRRTQRLANRCSAQKYIHFGMTAENQDRYDERIKDFRSFVQTGLSWLSAEPLLGPIDMQLQYVAPEDYPFDWVVVGAESGPKRRPCSLEWVRDIVQQCRENGVPVFVKQLDIGGKLETDICKFPEDLQIRQVPWHAVTKIDG